MTVVFISIIIIFLCSEVDIPDRLMPVGSRVSPKLRSAGVETDPEGTGGRQERRNTHGIVSTAPPNMKQVLYQDSYDEFMQKRSPVEPVSHCWSAQQTLYIGCEHGQLLLVDFESGIVSIAANPEIIVGSTDLDVQFIYLCC